RVADRTRELTVKNADLNEALADLKEAQDQLIMQEKMASVGMLTTGIAHEIKNPLNFVNNFSDLSIELVGELSEELEANKDKLSQDALEYVEGILTDLKTNC
ncbi:MAG TPA: histidine kinase dimerization/phospho-acceptor domain-containing protein, partial [Candidatus Berkiella sp.]|nr:histidine kinase dimerization/phospho-acceptor domain-containing protein [Candidatus Berkiella sp.]